MINEYKTRSRVFIGVLGALSSLLMAFEFPLTFPPAYMKFEISDVAAIMAGFFLRPGAAALTALIKILIKVFLTGSSTAFVGEWMALFCSLAYVLPASYFYHQFRTTQSAIPALLLGTGFASLFAVLANRYVALPLYVKMFGISLDTIVKMGSATNPFVHSLNGFLLLTVFPFNLIKYGIVSLVSFLLFKKSSKALADLINKNR